MNETPKKPDKRLEDWLIKADAPPKEQPKELDEIIENPEVKKETIELDSSYLPMNEDI